MLKINEKQLLSVFALSSEERYKHFVKVIADWEEVWGLYDEGWAMSETNDGSRTFPCWPAKEYAKQCAIGIWGNYEATAIPIDEFIEDFLNDFEKKSIYVSVFPNVEGLSVVQDASVLEQNLRDELELYA